LRPDGRGIFVADSTAKLWHALENILDARSVVRRGHPLANVKGLGLSYQIPTNAHYNYSVPCLWKPEFFGTNDEVPGINVAGDQVRLRSMTGSERHKLVSSPGAAKVFENQSKDAALMK
jgi:hypothetical protein